MNKKIRIKTLLLLVALLVFFINVNAQLIVPKVFGNNMVLQRNIAIPVWGKGTPGTEVVVEFAKSTVNAKVDSNGTWKVFLPEFQAGGPYEMKIYEPAKLSEAIIFTNILMGDVWLASGQSNMEWQVQQADGAPAAIAAANYPEIRLFKVEHAKSIQPASEILGGEWKVCDTNNVKEASAVAYYFARNLNADLKVPIGILQATWGGTPVEAWTSREALLSTPLKRQVILDNDTLTTKHFIKDSIDLVRFWEIVYNPDTLIESQVTKIAFDDTEWTSVDMPKTISNWGIPFYEGIVWMRKTIVLPSDLINTEVTIELGHPEMNYTIYVNGTQICKTQWNANLTHHYTIPAGVLTEGKNVVTARISALWGGGGFSLPAGSMYITNGKNKVSIEGEWKYKIGLESTIPKIYNYQYYPTFLYNAMIKPVVPYGLKGFIWYQGEANDSAAFSYRTLLPLMINDWRVRWQQGYLPFLCVQLPNYMQQHAEPSDSKWAEMREAQTLTLNQPNTGMACIIDLGNPDNIHPTNKSDVGYRLALVAEKEVYYRDLVATGPVFKNFKVESESVTIEYTSIGSGLVVKGAELKGFAVAGADQKYYWAAATIKGNTVVVKSDKVPHPVAVRYAWDDNPAATLFNKEGLPALPFRTDNWKRLTQQ